MVAAERLVLENGLSGTRIDQVCREAGVTKGRFYHHFESKQHMALALLEHFFERVVSALSGGDWDSISRPAQRLDAFLKHAERVAAGELFRRGCLLGTLSFDLARSDEALRSRLATCYAAVTDLVAPLIAETLRASGWSKSRADSQAQRHARLFIAALEGGLVLGKASRSSEMASAAIADLRGLFKDSMREE